MQGWQVFFEIPGKPPVELRDGESIIGRSRTSAVHIPETTVSRQHAKVAVVGGGDVRVSDLGSSNGTFVNGEKVEGERRLVDGDRVLIGDAELIIRILAPEPPADATVRVSIPPMGGSGAPATPATAGTVRMDLPPPSAGPGAATVAAPMAPVAPVAPVAPRALDLPLEPPRRPEPPKPPPQPMPQIPATPSPPPAPRPSLAPPLPPISAPVALPPSPAPSGGGDALSAIDFDKLGAPSPAAAGAAAPAASRRPSPGAAPAAAGAPGGVRYAGFWIRVVATLIDCVPMIVLSLIAFALTFFVDPTLGLLVNFLALPYWFFVALFLPATKGNSIGKKMMGLAIVTDSTRPGEGLGWGKAFLRLLGHFVASLTFSIGYLLVAFTSRKQGLHDLIAATYVVRVR